jgi:hypothetical protein
MHPAKLLLTALLCTLLQSQPPPPTPTKSGQPKQHRAESEDDKTDRNNTPPISISVVNTPVASDPTKSVHNESPADWWTRIFTGVIACATVAQAYIYLRQKQLMHSTLEQTTKAADAALKNANTARDELGANIRQFELSERPWLSIKAQPFSNLRYDGRNIHLDVLMHLHNIWKSTAMGMVADASLNILDGRGPEPIIEDMFRRLVTREPHRYAIFPNDSIPVEPPTFHISNNGTPTGTKIALAVVCGAACRSSFNSKKVYFTAEVYNVGDNTPGSQPSLNGVLCGMNLPIGQILFTRIYASYVRETDLSEHQPADQPTST